MNVIKEYYLTMYINNIANANNTTVTLLECCYYNPYCINTLITQYLAKLISFVSCLHECCIIFINISA